MGGLSRRNSILEQLRRERALVVVDGGNSLTPTPPMQPPPRPGVPTQPPPRAATEDEIAQWRIKADLIGAAYALGGIDGLALGASDWRLGRDWVETWASAHALPVLAANLDCDGRQPFRGGRVVAVAGRRVGLIGLTAGAPEGCTVTDPVVAAQRAWADLGPVDVAVVLAPIGADALVALGQSGLPAQLVVTAGGRPAPVPSYGSMFAFEQAPRGKHVGVLDLTFVEGATTWRMAGAVDALASRVLRSEQRLADLATRLAGAPDDLTRQKWEAQRRTYENQLARDRGLLAEAERSTLVHSVAPREIGLGDEVPDHPATRTLVVDAKRRLADRIGQEDPLRVPHLVPEGSAWAGSDACVACHRAEHRQWAGTAHARASSSLLAENRLSDTTCFGCHVTGAQQEGGPHAPAEIGPFRDVQCEACHGPSAAHASAPTTPPPVPAPGSDRCVGCHDGDRDGGRFDWEAYRPRIVHDPARPVRDLP
jgi:predicted CXXCH cytochrome family protein